MALGRLVFDVLGLVEILGTGGGSGPGGGGGGGLAVEVDGPRVVAIFISLEKRLPFFTFASVSDEGASKGSVDAAGRGRSFRGECISCGDAAFALGAGVGRMTGGGALLAIETLSVTGICGICGGGSGVFSSETLRA